MGIEKHRRPIMAPAFLNEDGTPYDPGIGQFVALTEKGAANGVATLDSTIKVPNSQLHLGEPGGPAGPLDGAGLMPPGQLPPQIEEVREAASEAEMLALPDLEARTLCVRTDFTPNRLFFLRQLPASTLSNWHDLGGFAHAAANPTAKSGPVATNGTAATYMRSDAAPAIDMTANFAWTGVHGWSQKVTLHGGAFLAADISAEGNTVTGLADPTDAQDAATKNYVDTAGPIERTSGTVQLQLDGGELIWPNSIEDGKIRLWNTSPASDVQYYGFGIQNGALVYQVDSNTSKHVFQGADQGTDSALPIAEMSSDGGIVSHVDLHMSEKKIINLGDPDSARDAVNFQTLNGRISAAQRTAIDALPTSGNSADDVVAALQAA